MATESEILTKLNDLLATYDGALSISGGSKLLTLARAGTGDTAAVVIKQGTGERWRLGQIGADAFALQRSPSGATVDYTDVLSISRSTGFATVAAGLSVGGFLGIGVASPSAALHIAGAGRIRNDFLANAVASVVFHDSVGQLWRNDQIRYAVAGPVFHSSSGEAMRVTATGVGIGTSSPGVRLDVAGAVRSSEGMRIETVGANDATLNMLRTDTGARAWLGIPNWNHDAFYIYGPTATGSEPALIYEAGAWRFLAAGTDRMRLDNAGRLLIGTSTSGSSKLRISGLPTSSAGLSAGDIWNDGGTLKIA